MDKEEYDAVWNKEKLEHQRTYATPEQRRMDMERIAISLMTGDGEDSGACFLEENPMEIIDYYPEDWDEYKLRNSGEEIDIPEDLEEGFSEDDNYIWFQFTPELFDELSDCIKKYDKDFVCPVEKIGNFFVQVSTQRITFNDWLFKVFYMATCVGDLTMIRHLLENKHNLYVKDEEEDFYAIDGMFRGQNKEMLDLFLEYGLDVNFGNGYGLKVAKESDNQEMIDALLSAGAVDTK